jgi:5-methylcytosine-specific restriction endonuclease McrA
MSNRIASHRSRAFAQQNGKCFYCDLPMWIDSSKAFSEQKGLTAGQCAQFECTAEHLQPKCGGGRDNRANIVAACHHCNATRHKRKKPLSPDQWRATQVRRASRRLPDLSL